MMALLLNGSPGGWPHLHGANFLPNTHRFSLFLLLLLPRARIFAHAPRKLPCRRAFPAGHQDRGVHNNHAKPAAAQFPHRRGVRRRAWIRDGAERFRFTERAAGRDGDGDGDCGIRIGIEDPTGESSRSCAVRPCSSESAVNRVRAECPAESR